MRLTSTLVTVLACAAIAAPRTARAEPPPPDTNGGHTYPDSGGPTEPGDDLPDTSAGANHPGQTSPAPPPVSPTQTPTMAPDQTPLSPCTPGQLPATPSPGSPTPSTIPCAPDQTPVANPPAPAPGSPTSPGISYPEPKTPATTVYNGSEPADGNATREAYESDTFSYSESSYHPLSSGVGVSVALGGGVAGFTDSTMRNTTTSNVSGLWDLRVAIGSHSPLALELGYVGTAVDIRGLSGSQTGTLVGSTAEAAVRYNLLPHRMVNPYAFAGLGWQRYDVTGGTFSLSDSGVADSDDSLVIPMGAGLSYRNAGVVLDARGTFRADTDPGLVLQSSNSTDYAPMHTWEASAALGYEF